MDTEDEPFPPSWLNDENSPNLRDQSIPQALDGKTTELLRTWMSWDEQRRAAAARQISKEQFWPLIRYAERMASLAVRDNHEELVVLGLVALVLAYPHGDYRDGMLRLAPLYDAANRLTGSPKATFEITARLFEPSLAEQVIGHWLKRTPHEQSLQAMGFVARLDTDGFRYRWQP